MAGKNSAYFQKLLLDRLGDMPAQADSEEALFHRGTERLVINFAFDRIQTGDYWHCVKCGVEISEERLLADPTTLLCAACTPVGES